ncbi:MAG: tyrosine-type recombinase/integrase [Hyphomicrobiales bacterium]|nr:tyrosine-type recombinase/integrase [Hyphomicrobiales bacterium]
MPRRLPPGCVEDRDRHGNIRIYYRAKGSPKVRLRGTPWTSEFMAQLDDAKADYPRVKSREASPGTWRWLCIKYFAECADYLRLDERTKRVRRGIIEGTFDEPIAPGSSRFFRDMPLARMTEDAVEVLRDRKIQTPESANARLKAIRQVFKFGVKKKLAPRNPSRDVEYFKSGSTGFHTWTPEEVQQFEARHPIGTKARLALALMLFTGQRRSDIIRFGKQHAKGGRLIFTQHKGRNRKPKRLTLPVLPALQRIIDATPCGDLTFLVNEFGRPFTDAGFGNWFRDRCVEASVPGRAHGLRKAGATIAANNGATSRQLMAIFGWDTLKEAERYTRGADQLRLAETAMHLLEAAEQNNTEPCPTESSGGTFSGNT